MSTLADSMSRAQKAAAILVAMGKPAASRMLKFFKQEELRMLVEGARVLRTIPQAELEKIVAEFEAEFAEGAGLLDSADHMDTILTESFSADEMNALMGNAPVVSAAGPPPVWPQLEGFDQGRLAEFLAQEHAQTAAVVVTNLSPATAANVLLVLEKPFRNEIVKRMMAITTIPPVALRIIENQIRARLLAETSSRDTSAGQIRVASLLNEMDKTQLDEVIQDLEQAGTPDLAAVRSRLFSFEDIAFLTQKARVTLFDGLSAELVTMALRNCPAPLGEAVLSSIGARSRRMIESELTQGSDDVPMAEVVKARKSIASTAIRMAREGSFELPSTQAAAA